MAERDLLEIAHDMRTKAERLRGVADRLCEQADVLEQTDVGGKKLLKGRKVTEQLVKLVHVGEVIHYQAADRRLRSAGYVAGGIEPLNTLLAALNRAPEFERLGRRSGEYRRVEVGDG